MLANSTVSEPTTDSAKSYKCEVYPTAATTVIPWRRGAYRSLSHLCYGLHLLSLRCSHLLYRDPGGACRIPALGKAFNSLGRFLPLNLSLIITHSCPCGVSLTLLPALFLGYLSSLGVEVGTGKRRSSLNLSGKLPPPDRRSGTLGIGMWG
jgi:hypothetical protein